jgi:hypothetical protein
VKFAVEDPRLHIFTVLSRHAEAKVLVSFGLIANPMT